MIDLNISKKKYKNVFYIYNKIKNDLKKRCHYRNERAELAQLFSLMRRARCHKVNDLPRDGQARYSIHLFFKLKQNNK